jgi:hypothetical protein
MSWPWAFADDEGRLAMNFYSIAVAAGYFLDHYSGTITGIATFLLAVITWRLVILGKEQSNTTRAQLRAYLLVDSIELQQGANYYWNAVVIVRNFGVTPAYEVNILVANEWRARSDIQVNLPLPGHLPARPSAVIAPGHPVNLLIDIGGLSPNPLDWAILANGGKRPFIWGRISYVDAFGRKRWSTFQFFSDLDGVFSLGHCALGNDADR